MRIPLALLALFALGSFAPPELFGGPVQPLASALRWDPVPLDAEQPERRRLGALTYLGGWSIRSDDPRFGGISAMHVADGEMVALSDAGWLIRFGLRPGQGAASIRPLPAGPGNGLSKKDRDAESLVVAGGSAWIGFEDSNQIWRYDVASWRATASAAPPAMRRWSANSGAEAMLQLPDGRFLVFSEGRGFRAGATELLLFAGDPAVPGTRAARLGYRPPRGYRITDAARLPDGRLLFLNRRFRWTEGVSVKLTLTPAPPRLSAGAIIEGMEIATFRAPVIADNLEAVSLTRERSRTILWIASDDNYNPLQRTLLLKFALD